MPTGLILLAYPGVPYTPPYVDGHLWGRSLVRLVPYLPPFQLGPGGVPVPEIEDCRPPLARSLFDNRKIFVNTLDEFPQCKAIVPRLRDPLVLAGAVSIEKRIEEIRDEARTYRRGGKELTALRCYLQRAIRRCEMVWMGITRGITNQLTLLREIERIYSGSRPTCLVTFNYDTLLETALELLGQEHKIQSMQAYASHGRLFRLFKLHGSVNWGLEFDGDLPPSLGLASPDFIGRFVVEDSPKLGDPELYVLSDALTLLSSDRRPVFPAVAIPVEEKNDFQCPKPALDALKQLMPDVSKVITIGWRASEAHFLSLLDTHLKPGVPVFVVAATLQEAEDLRNRIVGATRSARPVCRAENVRGFTKFMQSGVATKILAV
jgi:hypothetical protein